MDREKRFFQACSPAIQQWIQEHVKFGESAVAAVEQALGVVAVVAAKPLNGKPVATKTGRTRMPNNTVTGSEFYEDDIIRYLGKQPGGRGRAKEVIDAVFQKASKSGKLKEADYLPTPGNGVVRAENKIAFARNTLKDKGLLVDPKTDPTAYGQWVLTAKGRAAAKKLK
jgi:hypothetical protein